MNEWPKHPFTARGKTEAGAHSRTAPGARCRIDDPSGLGKISLTKSRRA
ncbi:MAG: hypothetical protein H0X34_10670 [Chthoniobacterales bacterium]|nr:hypothetical protein [Chthoniobacterales bacterium]